MVDLTGVLPATDALPTIGVRALIAELTDLPANPTVAMRVLQLLDDPRTDATKLGRLVETDPSLVAHTLRLANAPINGMTRRITSARHAVMVLAQGRKLLEGPPEAVKRDPRVVEAYLG